MLRLHGFYNAASTGRTLYFPYMRDGAYALAAASRSCGLDAWVLPQQTEEDVELGRKYTSSKECFPMICTTGSFIKKVLEPGFQPDKASFFMPDHNGPCRFGQYNRFQRILFNRLGFPALPSSARATTTTMRTFPAATEISTELPLYAAWSRWTCCGN